MYDQQMKTIEVIPDPPVITIDGTAGSGKGTISLQLAKKLGWHFLDSGVLYRALALLYLWHSEGLNLNLSGLITDPKLVNLSKTTQTENLLINLASAMQVEIDDRQNIFLSHNNKNRDITLEVRSEICGSLASQVAVFPKVRAVLLEIQRHFLRPPGLVADGRDMGTVVFPNAVLKIFLDADAKIRATRRHLQLKELGVGGTLHNRVNELSERDLRDSSRVAAPLKPAADAIIIDTTTMTIPEVFAIVVEQVNLIV